MRFRYMTAASGVHTLSRISAHTTVAPTGCRVGQSYDPQTGRLTAAIAGSNNAIESFGYTYDAFGNLLTRSDSNESLTETLTYDNLNRLTSATVSQNVAPVKTFAYDPVGNLLTKSDVGTYTYPPPGSPQPHAVTSIAGSAFNTTFTYDPNGNETSGLGRSITYASFNKPSAITQGSTTLFFNHDVDHQRYNVVGTTASEWSAATSLHSRETTRPSPLISITNKNAPSRAPFSA
jgi:YD repeat-containing protein